MLAQKMSQLNAKNAPKPERKEKVKSAYQYASKVELQKELR